MKSIHWFRNDLRLADNPALSAASGNDVLPIFILDPKDSEDMGQASKLWLHHSLNKLNKSLDGKLQFIHGDTIDEIRKLINSEKIDAIYWNKIFEPKQELKDRDLINSLLSIIRYSMGHSYGNQNQFSKTMEHHIKYSLLSIEKGV